MMSQSGPASWQIVTQDLWHLPEQEARAFWFALSQSGYWRPVQMRQRFALAGVLHITERFWSELCSPHAAIAVLEALCHEGRLSRAQTSKLEEHLLREVDQYGNWRGDAWDGVDRVQTHAPDVVLWAEIGHS